MKQIEGEVSLFLEEIKEFRRTLHRHPELAFEEVKTADAVTALLDREGIPYKRKGTAVTALIDSGKPGSCVALRADMDALPLTEDTGLEFASENPGRMHACGHDAHTAILMGAGIWLARHKDRFAGAVKLLFQPAEEGDGGALPMVEDGALENPRVDRVFGLHVMPYMPPGYMEVKKGALNGSSTLFKITVKGQSGHGAYPESGTDAIMISGHVITALQSVVSRRVSPLDSAVVSIGTIEGGKAGNIIADQVVMRGTMRTASNEKRDELVGVLQNIVENTARAHGGEGALDYSYGYAALINTDDEVDRTVKVGESYLGPDRILWKEKPSMGVEDFSFFLRERPGCFYHLGCGAADVLETGDFAPLHSTRFVFNEESLLYGIVMQTGIALEGLKE